MPVTKDFPVSYLREEADPEEIASDAWRHGRRVTYVFTEPDDTSWRFTVLVCAIEIARQLGVLYSADLSRGTDEKWTKVGRYLHHINIDPTMRVATRKP